MGASSRIVEVGAWERLLSGHGERETCAGSGAGSGSVSFVNGAAWRLPAVVET